MSGLGTSTGGGRYNGDVFVSCAKYQLALSSPPSRSTLQASDQPLVTASHRVQSATSRNTLRHIKKSRMRRRLASASLTTAKKTARMAAAASRETGTLRRGRKSAATISSTTTHSPLWWRVVTWSTSTSRTQPVTGCGGSVEKCALRSWHSVRVAILGQRRRPRPEYRCREDLGTTLWS